MDLNLILALVFVATGIVDLVMLRTIGARWSQYVRSLILVFAVGFILLGILLGLGKLRLA